MDLMPWMQQQGMLPAAGETVLCAVSGGRDSVCLLHYLASLGRRRGFAVAAAHYNHLMRPTAGRDEAFVAGLCRELSVPLYVERGDVRAIARQEGCQARLPVRSPKREKRTEHLTVFLLRRGAAAALRQRPDTGLLAGLWEYPHVPGALTEAEAARQLQMWGVSPTKWTKKLSARHIFTHVRWEMTGYVVEVDGLGPGDWLWAEAQQRERLAIPSAFEKFTAELKEGE